MNLLKLHTHCCSVAMSCPILWPHGLQHARLPCPSLSSGSLLKLVCIESVIPSNHLILCHSLLFLPSVFPSIRVFSNELALRIMWPKYWNFSISPSIEYSGLISFRIDWFDILAVQGALKSLLQHHSSKASVLQHSAFFMIQLSHLCMTTGKTIALTIWTFVGKVMSLLFNMLSRLVIAFLPRSIDTLSEWIYLELCLYCRPNHCQWSWFPFLLEGPPWSSASTSRAWASLMVKNLHAMQKTQFDSWVGKIPWRRERLYHSGGTTPVLWSGEFHGLYSPWGHRVECGFDFTSFLHFRISVWVHPPLLIDHSDWSPSLNTGSWKIALRKFLFFVPLFSLEVSELLGVCLVVCSTIKC